MSNPRSHDSYMEEAITIAIQRFNNKQGFPFGCVVVKDGTIVGRGFSKVSSTNDPTAHAEVVAIRDACKNLSTFELEGCVIYTTCEPCPMCLGAIYCSKAQKVFYGCSKADAASSGFDDHFIYEEIPLPDAERSIVFEQLCRNEALKTFAVLDNLTEEHPL